MAYHVTAPLVVARKNDGVYVHVYEGGTLPEDTDEEQIKQLLESEMIAEGDSSSDDDKPSRRGRRSDSE